MVVHSACRVAPVAQRASVCRVTAAIRSRRWPSCPAWQTQATRRARRLAWRTGTGPTCGAGPRPPPRPRCAPRGHRRCSTGGSLALVRNRRARSGARGRAAGRRGARRWRDGAGRRVAARAAAGDRPTARAGRRRPGRRRPARSPARRRGRRAYGWSCWPTSSPATSRVPAPVLAAVAHGELLTLAPFGIADGVVARAVSRLVTIASGLDPHGLGVPEVFWMRHSGDYRAAARGFAVGHARRAGRVAAAELPRAAGRRRARRCRSPIARAK